MTAEVEEKFKNLVGAVQEVVANAFPICPTTESECHEYVINADAYLALVERFSDLKYLIEDAKAIMGEANVDEC